MKRDTDGVIDDNASVVRRIRPEKKSEATGWSGKNSTYGYDWSYFPINDLTTLRVALGNQGWRCPQPLRPIGLPTSSDGMCHFYPFRKIPTYFASWTSRSKWTICSGEIEVAPSLALLKPTTQGLICIGYQKDFPF